VADSATSRQKSRLPSTQQLGLAGFGALVVLAVVFYLWWGLSYGVWVDNGVYAVVITLLLFGVAGLWLFWPEPPAPNSPSA
jgi:ABC-type dipeptide/oligopeptide/nickel transport system permease component